MMNASRALLSELSCHSFLELLITVAKLVIFPVTTKFFPKNLSVGPGPSDRLKKTNGEESFPES